VPDAPDDAIVALNGVLSELIDLLQELKQALREVPEHDALRSELDSLTTDTRSWAAKLMDEDIALGVSALSYMPSAAGRKPPNLWPGQATEEEVRHVLSQQLDQLAGHVEAAVARQSDEEPRAVLEDLATQVQRHVTALEAL
jgi:hypothetical protein